MHRLRLTLLILVLWYSGASHAQDAVPAQQQSPATAKEEGFSAPAPLPKALRGRWSNPASGHSDLIEIDVLEMTTPRDGKALVTFWPYCRKSETQVVFERKLKVWRFTASNCTGNAEQIHMRVRPIEGKNRMEGWYGGSGGSDGRSVFLEWAE